jgi:hypothetical protein
MTEGRRLATVNDYDGLLQALRQRSDELKISRATLDEISGLNSGYCGKLLSSQPVRGLGRTSLGPLLGAMGCALILVEDLAQVERIRKRLVKRKWWPKDKHAFHTMPTTRRRRRWTFPSGPEFAKLMNARRNCALDPHQRSAISRKAAKARWRRSRSRVAAAAVQANAAVAPAVPAGE